MTPYLVHKTWIDLDHVLAIDSAVTFETANVAPHFVFLAGSFNIQMMFLETPITISFEIPEDDPEFRGPAATAARRVLDDLIAAWKVGNATDRAIVDAYSKATAHLYRKYSQSEVP